VSQVEQAAGQTVGIYTRPEFIGRGLSLAARTILSEIDQLCTKSGCCWASNAHLAERAEVSVRTVTNALTELKDRGCITRNPHGKWIVCPVTQWTEQANIARNKANIAQANIADTNANIAEHVANIADNPAKSARPSEVTKKQNNEINKKAQAPEKRKQGPAVQEAMPLLPDGVTPELWGEFRAMRNKLRKPMTPYAEKCIFSELEKLREKGYQPADVLHQSIRKSWQDVFELKQDYIKPAPQRPANWGSTPSTETPAATQDAEYEAAWMAKSKAYFAELRERAETQADDEEEQ
jgi:hypothetical protein